MEASAAPIDAAALAAAVDETRGQDGTIVVALSGEVNAEVVLGRDGVGYLVSGDLPPLSSESTYQLWAIVDDRVISAGVLGGAPTVAPFNVDGAADVDVRLADRQLGER